MAMPSVSLTIAHRNLYSPVHKLQLIKTPVKYFNLWFITVL
jgi:hypothetical protein